MEDFNYLCLEGYWNFDEGEGQTAFDSSWNTNDGQLGSTSGMDENDPLWASGHTGDASDYALLFDDSDYVDCGNVMDVNNKLTVMAWVKDSGNSGGNVIGKYEDMNKRWHIYINSGFDGLIYWNVGGNNFGTSPSSVIEIDWHHLAMVYDGTLTGNENRLKAYIDGEQISLTFTGIIPDTMPTIFANVNIGRHSTSNFFQGVIDEVKVYSCALTEGEIQSQAGLPP
jgi:hypothetical protein